MSCLCPRMDRDLIKFSNNRFTSYQRHAQSNTRTRKRKQQTDSKSHRGKEGVKVSEQTKDKQAQTETGTGGSVCAKCRVIFWRLLTSSEMSSLLARFWLTAAREACSISRIHLLMLSIDESHSRWPGALSLRMKWEQEKKRQRAIKNGWKWEQSGRMMYRREKDRGGH